MLPSRIFFDNFFDDFKSSDCIDKMMKCDIYENDENYVIEMDVPGFKKEDINIEFENNYLTISVFKNSVDMENDNKKYIRRERSGYTKCERKFYVGNIIVDDIKARFNNGILEVSIPKKESSSEDKKIVIIED